ncbi:HigA family addiction module antitoxin [Spectribacter hydrogenoxidans]|uniref:HigA family addiction module antitoxin n=1 Tax=Spectribacter hydrogenoxidans TaxID=3075608 RepID=A0ABU3C4A3_9GAMM|nr:HigA family addiction module antitoxin [Salinisphaera sp. W335]MDT0636370.1 HigA family addiction module antitoxin [Salinisphaera sp. W335]
MTNVSAPRLAGFEPDWLSPPGDTIAEVLDERGLSQRALARRTGFSAKFINQLIAGKAALTEETALKLERVLGSSARFWLNLESRYRETLARQQEREKAKCWVGWLNELPVKELMKAGAIPHVRLSNNRKPDVVLDLLRFFGVASPQEWVDQYDALEGQYRRTRKEQCDEAAIAGWLRMGERAAAQQATAFYSRSAFMEALRTIRGLTVEPPSAWQPKLIELCAQAGVALVFVPAIRRAHVSGVARWLSSDKALIQLSVYGKWNDRMWFTFFHEAGHILMHAKKAIFLDDPHRESEVNQQEEEANRFASEFLIPRKAEGEFSRLSGAPEIIDFAQSLGIHPGIVVGRLQHEGLLEFNQLNYLKDRFEFVPKAGSV